MRKEGSQYERHKTLSEGQSIKRRASTWIRRAGRSKARSLRFSLMGLFCQYRQFILKLVFLKLIPNSSACVLKAKPIKSPKSLKSSLRGCQTKGHLECLLTALPTWIYPPTFHSLLSKDQQKINRRAYPTKTFLRTREENSDGYQLRVSIPQSYNRQGRLSSQRKK